jgi:hypothetical protein
VAVAVPSGWSGWLVYETELFVGKPGDVQKLNAAPAHKAALAKLYEGNVVARAVPFDHTSSRAAPAMRLIDFVFT